MNKLLKGRAVTPAEKKAILEKVYAAWAKYPLLRLGQLIDNAMHGTEPDLFTIEDEALAQKLLAYGPTPLGEESKP